MKRARCLSTVLLCVTLSACSQLQYRLGEPIEESIVATVPDRATIAGMMTLFGPPLRVSAGSTGYLFAWEYWEVDEDAVGFNLGPLGADFLSVDVARVHSRGQYLIATFDSEHRLTALNFSDWDNRLGDGRALQPLGIYDVATTGDLVERLPQHRWGQALLEELPKGLNRASDPDLGQGGLEQRATPIGIGQRTLEMD